MQIIRCANIDDIDSRIGYDRAPVSGRTFPSRLVGGAAGGSAIAAANRCHADLSRQIKDARRFYLTFDITRDGRPTNVQVEQSSGVPSLDISAVRAVQRIDTFGPLPPDYSGSKVSVEFWFDYKR